MTPRASSRCTWRWPGLAARAFLLLDNFDLYGSPILSYVPIVKWLRRYWGYLALALAIVGLVTHTIGYAVISIFSIAAFAYFLVQAPVWCGAITRQGQLCRNNSTGVLLGCRYREHKWQKLKMTFVPKAWRQLNHGLWAGPKEVLATVGSLTSVVSLAIALIALH